MRNDYDFSKSTSNPYAKALTKPVTIRLDEGTIEYFKGLAEKKGLPYQSLISLYLRDALSRRKTFRLSGNRFGAGKQDVAHRWT